MMVFVVFFYGLLLGSFINALVWRLYVQDGNGQGKKGKRAHRPSGRKVNYSIISGRSMCPTCKHSLAAKDLVPVFSWILLRGRCRYCQKPISIQYPLIELLTGLLFIIFYLGWPLSLSGFHLVGFGYSLVYGVFFVALALYDAKWFLLPDRLVFPLTALVFSEVTITSVRANSWQDFFLPLASGGIIFTLFWLIYQFSQGRWIGGGDVKLVLALGMIAGTPLMALMVVFVASVLGTCVSIPSLLLSKKKEKRSFSSHIPFGPYLLAGCVAVMLFGEKVAAWYEASLL